MTGVGNAGRKLVEHPQTSMVAFTGSVPTGKAIASKCGEMMKPTLIETSGNDSFLVMPSAPLVIAARAIQIGNGFGKVEMVWIDPYCGSHDFWWFPYDDQEAFQGE